VRVGAHFRLVQFACFHLCTFAKDSPHFEQNFALSVCIFSKQFEHRVLNFNSVLCVLLHISHILIPEEFTNVQFAQDHASSCLVSPPLPPLPLFPPLPLPPPRPRSPYPATRLLSNSDVIHLNHTVLNNRSNISLLSGSVSVYVRPVFKEYRQWSAPGMRT
jgi:hypothetical protein